MDWSALRVGLSIGVGISMLPIILLLPASYVMNTFIYHHWAIRLILGIFISYFPVISLIVVAILRLVSWKSATYFGLLPLYTLSEDIELPGGYFTFLYRIFYAIIDPFLSHENISAYKQSIQHFLVAEESPFHMFGDKRVYKHAVPEFFFEASRSAGRIEDTTKWTEYMKQLETLGVGKYVFGTDEPEAKKEQS
jgi:hypothetical protein